MKGGGCAGNANLGAEATEWHVTASQKQRSHTLFEIVIKTENRRTAQGQ